MARTKPQFGNVPSFSPEPAATGYGAKVSLCEAMTCCVFLHSVRPKTVNDRHLRDAYLVILAQAGIQVP